MKTRTKEMHLRLTPEEKETLTEKAKLARLSREEFCRRILNGATVKEAPSADVRQLLRQMRHIGSNLNQLLACANTVGFIDTVQLKKDLAELRKAQEVIVEAYTK